MDETKCKADVYRGRWSRKSQCDRKPWKDGWCKQHHPDSVKAREEASEKRWEENRKQQPWYKLREAQRRIAELEAEVAALRSANAVLTDAVRELFAVLDAHEIDTFDCDRAGVVHCDCLERARKKVESMMPNKLPPVKGGDDVNGKD